MMLCCTWWHSGWTSSHPDPNTQQRSSRLLHRSPAPCPPSPLRWRCAARGRGGVRRGCFIDRVCVRWCLVFNFNPSPGCSPSSTWSTASSGLQSSSAADFLFLNLDGWDLIWRHNADRIKLLAQDEKTVTITVTHLAAQVSCRLCTDLSMCKPSQPESTDSSRWRPPVRRGRGKNSSGFNMCCCLCCGESVGEEEYLVVGNT